ncbi:putative septum site-determining protein MinC OS=Castellaniella defragrans OX=75697 GN=minC PE=3 SV=1 [Castellaniella defragrans]
MAKTPTALDFKSATLYALRVVLHSSDTEALLASLNERMREAGAFYENESVAIDATGLEEAPDWEALLAALRGHHLHPIGIQAAPELQDQARQCGLAPLDLSAGPTPAPAPVPAAEAPAASAAKAAKTPSRRKAPAAETKTQATAHAPENATPDLNTQTTLVIRHPLRSGQRIYAKGGDLVVLGMVSQGAEVIADGHIHVYGPLRGKAMAGAHGRTDAMILTTQLDPELLAIAGVYRVIETRLPETLHNRPAQISLDGDTLRIRTLEESNGHA